MNMKNNKSFTLVEIMLVIIIIGVLATVIVFSTSSYIEETKMTESHTFSSNAKKQLAFNILQEWKFDEGSGSKIYDINKSSNSGTLVNINTAAGWGDNGDTGWLSSKYCVSGTCLNFKGDETDLAYVNTTDTGKIPLFTLSVWVYNIAGLDSRHSMLRDFWEIVGENVCFWSSSFANTYWRCSTGSKVVFDRWSYVTTVWDGAYISHYINGELNWKDSSISSGTSENFYQIAGYLERRMRGRLDEMTIYNKDLSLSEIKQNYVAGLDSLLAQGGLSKQEYNERIMNLAEK